MGTRVLTLSPLAGDLLSARIRPFLLPATAPVRDIPGLRQSAVLLLLHGDPEHPSVLLTERSDTVPTHAGQISLPGGGRDPADPDLAATARRETEEEVGVNREAITIVGRMPDLPSISFYQVVPFVGVTWEPIHPIPKTSEVTRVLRPTVDELLAPGSFSRQPRLWRGLPIPTYSYLYQDHVIWGLTARILMDFLATWSRSREP